MLDAQGKDRMVKSIITQIDLTGIIKLDVELTLAFTAVCP